MRRLIVHALLTVCLALATSAGAVAQTSGAGGIIDFIHKLSGPQFLGGGITGWGTLEATSGIRARLSVIHRWSVDEEGEVTPATNLSMLTVQPSLEFPLKDLPVDLSVGIAFHRFQKNIEPFWHYSFPVYLQGLFALDSRDKFLLRPGIGFHVFPAFGEGDFSPLGVDVSRDKAEVVLNIYLGFDFRLTKWSDPEPQLRN